ncbi:MAG: site-2 protease family protein [Polyangiaceae bacterium]
MSWSYKLVRVFGIEIRVHVLFGLLVLWQAGAAFARTGTLGAVLASIAFVLLLFSIIVLHELGHALAARRFGIRTLDITLLPIGGVARLERMPEKPRQELVVALAGPAVNVVLAAVLLAVHAALGKPIVAVDLASPPLLTSLLYVNVALAAFNLLPAFPMDGGRVLRAALALRGDRLRATRIAARIGQGFAYVIGFVGLFASSMLVVIALFIWIGAAAELASLELEASLRGLPLEYAMLTACDPLLPEDTLDAAARLTIAHGHRDFPVVDAAGRVVGVLTGARLVEGLALSGPTARVSEVMDPRIEAADLREPIEGVLTKLQGAPAHAIVVLADGRVRGLITGETIQQLASLRDAAVYASKHRGRHPIAAAA